MKSIHRDLPWNPGRLDQRTARAHRMPATAHGVLTRLHDLTLLEAHGVRLDAALVRSAVEEAHDWVSRILDAPRALPQGGLYAKARSG